MLRSTATLVRALAAAFALFVVGGAVTASAQTRYPINIQSTPAGATVFLDSTSTPALGVTPLRSVRVARGNHNFIFRFDGYQETTVAANVTRYGQTVVATLPQLARLQITAADESAQGATVSISGERRGTVPLNESILPSRVQITITREGYISAEQWVTLTPGQVFAWPVTLQRNAPRVGSLAVFADLRSSPVFVDGAQRCQTPCTLNDVTEGPHLVEIRPTQAGARPFTQQVTVVAGQTATVDAQIEVAPQTGSIRVISQTPGAAVTIDGEPAGASPATREGLQPGDHIVAVTAAGYIRQQQTVTVAVGQQRVVAIDLEVVPATSGTLRVIGTPRGAIVTVDGEPVGELPAERQGLSAGDHVVEVTMQGYVTSTQTVTIVAGQPRVVSVTLAESPREPGRIVIRANVPGATVLIDGQGPYPVPYAQDRAPVGTHAVIIRAPGYTEFSQTCEVGPGRDCTVDAQLQGARIPLRVQVQTGVEGAVLLVDGSEAGPLPYSGQVGVGQHRIVIRANGYRDYEETISIADNDAPRVMDLRLRRTNELTEDEVADREVRRERAMRSAFTRTGANLPADLANVEILGGWPYLAEVRLNMGVHEHADVGLTVRNAGRITEFLVRGRAGWRVNPRFSWGAQVALGGGVGPTREYEDSSTMVTTDDHKTNNFVMTTDVLASLHLNRAAAFTVNVGFDLTSDRYDFSAADKEVFVTRERQLTGHARVGATLEVALANHDSLTFSAQGIFGPNRRILGDMFGNDDVTYENSVLGSHIQLQIGWTHKFNWRWDDEL